MSAATLTALYTTAASCLDADDFDGAIRAAMKAKLLLATMPQSARDTIQLGWQNAEAADVFISQCQRLQASARAASSGPWQSTKVTYARAATT